MPAYFRTAHPTAIGNVMLTGINVRYGSDDHRDAGRPRVRRRGRRLLYPPALVEPVLDNADVIHVHDEWSRRKFDEGKDKSREIYGSPSDPALKAEDQGYLKKRLSEIAIPSRAESHRPGRCTARAARARPLQGQEESMSRISTWVKAAR